jgi:hypothetical protein
VQGGGNLEAEIFLGGLRIVTKSDFSADAEALLLWFDLGAQIVVGEGEGLAVKSIGKNRKG